MSVEIWKCTAADIPWLMRIARMSYGGRIARASETEAWLTNTLWADSPNNFIWRARKAAVIGMCATPFFAAAPVAAIQFFAGKNDEVGALFRQGLIWARERGAVEGLHFKSSTGFDIDPLAKSLGAEVQSPSYLLRF